MLEVEAFLHQYQRPIVRKQNCKVPFYILATPADFYLAFRIAREFLQTTLMNIQQRALEALTFFKGDDKWTAGEISVKIGKTQSTTRQLLNSLMYNGFLLRDDSKKPYKFYLKTSTNAYTCSVAQFEEVFASFDETELDNYLESNFLHARRRELSKTVIDPISGESMELANLSFEKLIALPSRACEKTLTEPKTPSLSLDEMLEPSVSSTEDVKPKPKIIIWSAETNKELRKSKRA